MIWEMSEIESKLKEQNEYIKELFNFDAGEAELKHIKELFTNYIKNDTNDFILFLVFYSKCRPHHHVVSKSFIECVYSCFPDQIIEIQQQLKNEDFLKYIMYPEEFPIKRHKEQKEMFILLQKDDADEFISFISKNPTIDLTKEQELESGRYYSLLFNYWFISLIDVCCFFGSLKCFKYLLLNKCEITRFTHDMQLQEEIKKLLIFSKKKDIHLKNV